MFDCNNFLADFDVIIRFFCKKKFSIVMGGKEEGRVPSFSYYGSTSE